MFDIQEELKKLPKCPGVYIMHDEADTIIYVGKAINLHNRVRSYFRKNIGRGPQIDKMVTLIRRFEYNTMLKDDKTYPYIKVTVGEAYPRVLFSRMMKKDHSKYFGPYTSAAAVKDTIELINKLYQLRTCNKNLPKDCGSDRACLNYHIGQCMAPCQGNIPEDVYRENVKKALDFLNGNYQEILKELEQKMQEASENLKFEEAIRYRDLFNSVKQVAQKQKITGSGGEDKDVIALACDGTDAVVQVFFVRDGKLMGREHFYMTHVSETPPAQILLDFVKQFYAGTPFIPRELMLQEEIEDTEILEQWLTKRKGARVYIKVPKIGTKEKLVELAAKNAQLVLSQDKERIRREEGRTIGAAREIGRLLGLENVNRMEAYDISNISGFANVGSMVVYEKGKPKRSDYRKFRIKTVSGPDDYACMREVLTRRFVHGMEEQKELAEKDFDNELGSFTKFPDLIMMDGGRGQVNIALSVLEELHIDIPVCGMVKDDNHRTRGLYFHNEEIPIDRDSEGFKLITRIQDEAHRFAIEYHRSLRSKSQVKSVLDEIPGVGPARRKALMHHFKSIEEIKNADVETLSSLDEIPANIAEDIYRFFHTQ